jgi:hypothetical protein
LKAHLLRALRILVSLALLGWILSRAHLPELMDRLTGATWSWILLAFAVNSAGNLLGAWRWRVLLRSQGRHVSVPYLFGSYFVGLFFNNVLPSSIGGDFFRATSARRKSGGTLTGHLTVVLVERMIGLLATLMLGGAAALSGRAGALDPRIGWALGLALVGSVVGLYLALSAPVRQFTKRLAGRVPIARVGRTVSKMLDAFELFSRARGSLLANLGLSLGFQFLLIVHFWLIQFAFGESLPLATFIVVVPLVFFLMMLPLGINGLGVREAAFVELLGRAGMDPETALALSLVSYAIAVGQGLLGGLVFLYRGVREKGDPALAEDSEEIART